jgi:hypothetical protein
MSNPENPPNQKQPNNNNTKEIHTTNQPNTKWRNNANCKGKGELMFPKAYKDITYIPAARSLCRNCTVQTQCLEYALQFPTADLHGVWAGLTPRQLAAEQRKRGIKPIRPTLAQMWANRL